ncbi:endopeptidase La [Azospirillum thermophilum]|uniref:Lon protease n=1 Tax=Azospirillum thermophilum TaxID=2202148 RepID=A0A2S2CR04_9PROT|nr:endopeptidase La [Azospirillum thermophilum]AWK86918.1 endopeptidase La [Azospirillum thermophilum]
MSEAQNGAAPARTADPQGELLPIIPVRNLVLFPNVVVPVTVARPRSVAAAQEAVRDEGPVGILLQRDTEVEEPTGADMFQIGTLAGILRYVTTPDGQHHLVCQGRQRFRVTGWEEGHPHLMARIERVEEPDLRTPEVLARFGILRDEAMEALQLLPQAPPELLGAIRALESPGELADLTASYMDLRPSDKQEVLELFDLPERLDHVSALLARRIEVLRLSRDIRERTRESMDERQREYLLREQLRTIQKELGEADEGRQSEIAELQEAIAAAGMPPDVREQAEKELRRLERTPEAAAEHSMIRSYLDWLIEMPWSRRSEGVIDIAGARRILDEDHYGLEKVKRRILEFLAARKLNPDGRSPILCFVGPPGVGKTSLGQSIARATGRAFARLSLGGVHDESEIRGHRRTYIGALPGAIVQAIRKAGTSDCVLMLDEMDKLGQGFRGDPSAALLEVLDPEQNATFRDHYLDVPVDLSRVIFIATANMLDTIPGPLLDRMEVIEISGYTEDEKLEIAKRYLVRRQRAANGLGPDQVVLPDETLRALIRDYTREAGNRNLDRLIGAVCRHVAVRVAEGLEAPPRIGPEMLAGILGPPRFENDAAMRTSVPGVATGLAWTPVGGDILFIEASRYPGTGRLILTGQLGDVMKESAQAALSLVKTRVRDLGLDPEGLDKSDIHIHVPAGAIPKDGPSAGIAIFSALVSLLSGRCVRSDTAMTGEISLRGLVLPVGGIKEKVVAAQRAGLSTVLLPARNRKDFDDIPPAVRDKLQFVWLDRVDDAVRAALVAPCQPAPLRSKGAGGGRMAG